MNHRAPARDRVGIGWRPELAASLYAHLEQIDAIEIIADNYFRSNRRERGALKALAREVPMSLHGVGLGLASAHAVDPSRIDALARLVDAIEPESWSEHLAFVRAGGIEIGHLAAPPRTAGTIDGARRNIEHAARIIGAPPQLENIATLIDPPASTLDEPAWIRAILQACDVPMLLDLHNLYANACNFGHDPHVLLDAMPLERVRSVHLSGGVWVDAPSGAKRLLDDHLHAPPPIVYALLTHLAERVMQPLTVILERDGDHPSVEVLLDQMSEARVALARGRDRRSQGMRRAA